MPLCPHASRQPRRLSKPFQDSQPVSPYLSASYGRLDCFSRKIGGGPGSPQRIPRHGPRVGKECFSATKVSVIGALHPAIQERWDYEQTRKESEQQSGLGLWVEETQRRNVPSISWSSLGTAPVTIPTGYRLRRQTKLRSHRWRNQRAKQKRRIARS
jgi:hypothetical protein